MTEEKFLGKITTVDFGFGGYQDAMIGVSFTLESDKDHWGCGDFKGWWGTDIKVDKHTKWSEEDRNKSYSDVVRFINKLLVEAKKRHLHELKGVPVEVIFEDMKLKSWRILTEVI
jgi:hypothetical protein